MLMILGGDCRELALCTAKFLHMELRETGIDVHEGAALPIWDSRAFWRFDTFA